MGGKIKNQAYEKRKRRKGKMSEKENKRTFMEKLKKAVVAFRKRTVWIPVLIVLVLLIAVIVWISIPKADTRVLLGVITKSSELTTAKIKFTSKTDYEDSGVAFINKSNFIMMYDAEARVGIDVEKVKVRTNNFKKIVYVEIPRAKVLDVKVDVESIQYFDEKFSLFNFNKKEDSNKAIAMAENSVEADLDKMGVIPLADKQSETLIVGLLANAVPKGYTIEVEIME